MQFVALHLKNFMSFEDQAFNIGAPDLVLIEGKNRDEGDSNGSGKSSIWDGISFALFGSTVRGLKGDDIINRKFGKECSVRVELSCPEKVSITRYRKHSKFGDRLMVEKSGELVEYGTIAQTQEWLEKFLKIDSELFRCTILFAQGETFNFVNAGNKAQKEILSKVMRIDYAKYLVDTKNKLHNLQDKRSEAERKIEVLNSHLIENTDDIFKDEILEWEESRTTKISNLKAEATSIMAKKSTIIIEPIDGLNADREKINDAVDKLRTKVSEFRDAKVKALSEVSHLQKESRLAKELLDKGVCPHCSQAIDESHLCGKIEGSDVRVTKLEAFAQKCDENTAKLQAMLKRNAEMLTVISEKIAKQRELKVTLDSLNAAFSRIVSQVKELKAETNPFLIKKEEEEKKQIQIRGKIEKLNTDLAEVDKVYPYYEFFVTAFGDSGIKSFVFDLVCSTLTNKANKYLNILTDSSISVAFDTQTKLKSGEYREKFECSVMSDGKAIPYDSYSGGEKRRVSLAVDMALSSLMNEYSGTNFNIMVFDEQTNGLDRVGRKCFMALLEEEAKSKKVFVVDHDAEFRARFSEVWTIQKEKGISRLITGDLSPEHTGYGR